MDLPRNEEEVKIWIKLPTDDIVTHIDDKCKHINIYYKPSSIHAAANTGEIDNGITLIIGYPPVHVYLRTAYYEKQGYTRIIVKPF